MLRPMLIATALLTAVVSAAPAAVGACELRADSAASPAVAGYYERLHSSGGFVFSELWQEKNGEPGLQSSAGMSCLGAADHLVERVCVGLCPLTL